jgi:hypothetical protein
MREKMMKSDCHIHFVLDGQDWKASIARHSQRPQEDVLRHTLKTYQEQGYTYLRDGGDRWGVGLAARKIAPEYGIVCRTPGAPLYQKGCYGSFIGEGWENLEDYRKMVKKAKKQGVDFIKIMISGLMDFNHFGLLTQPGLSGDTIRELIYIAHSEGFSVMAHANGADTVLAAAAAGVDSVEHGAYLNEEALAAMVDYGTVWVPTLSTIGNLRGKGRFDKYAVSKILDSALYNVSRFREMGGLLAPGTDAGAWAVPHGCGTEEALLAKAGVTDEMLAPGVATIQRKF